MSKKSTKTWLIVSLALALSVGLLLLGIFLGMTISYIMATTVRGTHWVTNVHGNEIRVQPVSVVTEDRNTPPFAAHLEESQKRRLDNQVQDRDEHTSLRLRTFGPHGQPLIRQKVFSQFGHITLDWQIYIDGWVDDSGSCYHLWVSHVGGNFAGCDTDYYIDFDAETQRLTLHIRQQLYRGAYKRYQFEFELQDNPMPSRFMGYEGEIPSIFVPVR